MAGKSQEYKSENSYCDSENAEKISGVYKKGGVMMDKMQYERPEMEIIHFNEEDIITTSGESTSSDSNELGWIDEL